MRHEEDNLVTSLCFNLGACFHLMWRIFSSVFNRLRLGCTKSSSESSVSSSFSLVSKAWSASGVSGKVCPGNIPRSFSSKHWLTASPDIAISEPTCQKRRGWEWWEKSDNAGRGCENTVKREEGTGRSGRKTRRNEDTDLELVNTLDGRLALAQRCTRASSWPLPLWLQEAFLIIWGPNCNEEDRCCTVKGLSLHAGNNKRLFGMITTRLR